MLHQARRNISNTIRRNSMSPLVHRLNTFHKPLRLDNTLNRTILQTAPCRSNTLNYTILHRAHLRPNNILNYTILPKAPRFSTSPLRSNAPLARRTSHPSPSYRTRRS